MASSAVTPKRFEAGRMGKDVRSDLHVAFEPRESGGIELELVSRVASYYGTSIREQATRALEHLGVHHARLVITDEGALPFVIDARIEAAVKRAGLGHGKSLLPESYTAVKRN